MTTDSNQIGNEADDGKWAAFISTIKSNPRDRLSRLVFADWLEEAGSPEKALLADFIRVVVRRKELEALLGIGSAPWWQGSLVDGDAKKRCQKELNALTSRLRRLEKLVSLKGDEFDLLRWKVRYRSGEGETN